MVVVLAPWSFRWRRRCRERHVCGGRRALKAGFGLAERRARLACRSLQSLPSPFHAPPRPAATLAPSQAVSRRKWSVSWLRPKAGITRLLDREPLLIRASVSALECGRRWLGSGHSCARLVVQHSVAACATYLLFLPQENIFYLSSHT
jgi:hypothetical protein